jgi:hypothetical protein
MERTARKELLKKMKKTFTHRDVLQGIENNNWDMETLTEMLLDQTYDEENPWLLGVSNISTCPAGFAYIVHCRDGRCLRREGYNNFVILPR